jgi:hypothetical protein
MQKTPTTYKEFAAYAASIEPDNADLTDAHRLQVCMELAWDGSPTTKSTLDVGYDLENAVRLARAMGAKKVGNVLGGPRHWLKKGSYDKPASDYTFPDGSVVRLAKDGSAIYLINGESAYAA